MGGSGFKPEPSEVYRVIQEAIEKPLTSILSPTGRGSKKTQLKSNQ
jgi:hypothetical protein